MKSIASILFTLCIYSSSSSTASGTRSTNNNFMSAGHRSNIISNHDHDGIPQSSTKKNYSSGLDIVNQDHDANNHNEYVTNFYRQKRQAKRRDLLATAAKNSVEAMRSNDHSLDHYYFDHCYTRPSEEREQLPQARVASSVRGGSISQQQKERSKTNNHDYQNYDQGQRRRQSRKNSQQRQSSAAFVPRHRRRGGQPHVKDYQQRHDSMMEETDVDEFNNFHHDRLDEDEEYDGQHYSSSSRVQEYHDNDDTAANKNNKSSMTPHQAGLLRLPCSLRLNSDETTSYHHPHTHYSTNNNKFKSHSTPIAAYIDTGAQVTVISASAARKIGILHLMDRRYAGRATGVGSCRILGRIPAGCVQFVLGNNNNQDDDDYSQEGIEMNGPALTVLEGTVTEGVDMLVGLDVLQEWEATIRMGGCAKSSSIAVRKRGRKDPVVLPFLVDGGDAGSSGGNNDDSGGGGGGGRVQRRRMSTNNTRRVDGGKRRQQQQHRGIAAKTSSSFHHNYNRRQQQQQQQQQQDMVAQQHHQQEEEEEDDDDFSPISSDIESDLDMLDKSEFTHGFPENDGARRKQQCSDEIVQDIEREDELLGVRHTSQHYRDAVEEDDDDYLHDSSDEDNDEEDLDFDMSGL